MRLHFPVEAATYRHEHCFSVIQTSLDTTTSYDANAALHRALCELILALPPTMVDSAAGLLCDVMPQGCRHDVSSQVTRPAEWPATAMLHARLQA